MKTTNIVVASAVLLVHIGLIGLTQQVRTVRNEAVEAIPLISTTAVLLPRKDAAVGDVPLPVIHLATVKLTQPALLDISFEDPDADTVPGIIGASSAPQPAPSAAVDQTLYALRAGLVPGESATVVFSIEVLADGSVGQVIVQSSSGNPSVDAEAAALVHAMRWIPGTVGRRAITMRVQYAITLAAPA